MLQEYRNIYQIAREATGLTQEKAAELMDVSVESVRAYEGSKRIPPDKIVIKMIEIYDARYLAYQHLKTSAEVGQKYLPVIKLKNLAEAVLTFLDECEDLEKIKNLMIKISRDGEVSDGEKSDWNQIMKEVDDMVSAGIALKFAK